MLMIISPAKTLDISSPYPSGFSHHTPALIDHAAELIERLKTQSPVELAQLMSISDKLAVLNAGRFSSWAQPFNAENARPALFTFMGDVYEGIDAASLTPEALSRAERQLRILSGLYGVLAPMDWMQPYRLEMGTRLNNPRGKNLYAFWGDLITEQLNIALEQYRHPDLINLASEEYFKAINTQKLQAKIITPVFQEQKNGHYKVVSFHAKRARGLMVRYALENGLERAEDLKSFDQEGYCFTPEASKETVWIFRRQ